MPRRLLSFLVLAAIVLGSASCSGSSTAALEVNGEVYSHADLKEELDQLTGNKALLTNYQADLTALKGTSPRTYAADFADNILTTRVQYMLVAAERDKRKVKITAADRTQARSVAFNQPADVDKILAGFTKSFAKRYIDDIAGLLALQAALGDDEFTTWISTAVDSAEVKVSPRYGSWNATQRLVVPPKGSTPAGGATTSTTL